MARRSTYGEGSVKQVGPDRWHLRWSEGRDPFTGKHIRRSTTVTAKSLTEARRELRIRTAVRTVTSRLTVGELIEAALVQLPISDRTRDTYSHVLKHIPAPARDWNAADMSVMDAKRIMDGLADRKVQPQTVHKIHGALMACWRQAYLNGWVTTNPWRGQRKPTIPPSAGRALTDAEVDAVKAACGDDLERLWIDLHLATGARPGEVVGLRWSAVDLDDLVLTFVDAKHKGAKRPVAIPPTIADRIRAWQVKQRERALSAGGGLDADPYLISNTADSSEPWRVAYAGSYRWPALRTRAGIRKGLRLYDLRHTHNSWLAADGMDSTTRAQRIGNSPATNERTYSHSIRDREAAEAVARRLV